MTVEELVHILSGYPGKSVVCVENAFNSEGMELNLHAHAQRVFETDEGVVTIRAYSRPEVEDRDEEVPHRYSGCGNKDCNF